jgi:hypothetical protein
MSTYEAFKNLAAGIQSIGVTLAVIVGSIWSVYTFSVLRLRKKAEAELFEQAVLDITVDAKQEHLPGNQQYYIAAVATVVNKGNRNTFLDFRGTHAFRLSKVEFKDSGEGVGRTLLEMKCEATYLTLRRGASWRFPVLLRVAEKGFYLIEFSARLSEEEVRVHDETAHDDTSQRPGALIFWHGTNYVSVS